MIVDTKQGSATSPRPENGRGVIIAHLNNQIGAWGAGFVLAVDDLSPIPKRAYKELAKKHANNIPMGIIQQLEIEPDLWVANMIAQKGISRAANAVLVDYDALAECLNTVFKRAVLLDCDVHIPAGMGSGLAGGDKQKITDMICSVADAWQALEQSLENQTGHTCTVVLWEFQDTSAASYIPTKDVPAALDLTKDLPAVFDLDDDGILDIDIL